MDGKTALRRLREEREPHQGHFAARAGLPQSLVSEVEGGTRVMTTDFALKAGEALDVDPALLWLIHSYTSVVSKVKGGDRTGLTEALSLAQNLVGLLEGGDLNTEQRGAAKATLGKLLALVEDGTDSDTAAVTKSADGFSEGFLRAALPRYIDIGESPSAALKASPDTNYESPERDSFGRKLTQSPADERGRDSFGRREKKRR